MRRDKGGPTSTVCVNCGRPLGGAAYEHEGVRFPAIRCEPCAELWLRGEGK